MIFIDIDKSSGRLSWQMTLLGQTMLALERFGFIFVAGGLFSLVFFFPNWYFGKGGDYLFSAVAAIVLFFSAVFAASRYVRYETWTFDVGEEILVYNIHSPIQGDEQYRIEFEDVDKMTIETGGGLFKSSISMSLGDEDTARTLVSGYFHNEISTLADEIDHVLAETPSAPTVEQI